MKREVRYSFIVIASTGDDKPSGILSVQDTRDSSTDYLDRRSLAISIPDYTLLEVNGEKFYVNCRKNF